MNREQLREETAKLLNWYGGIEYEDWHTMDEAKQDMLKARGDAFIELFEEVKHE